MGLWQSGSKNKEVKKMAWHGRKPGWYGESRRHSEAARKGGRYHYTKRYKRERVREPSLFQRGSFRTIDPGRKGGTKIIIGRLKGKKTTTTQAILRER